VLSLKFVVAFYSYYCAQIPELIEELRGGVVMAAGEELSEPKDALSVPTFPIEYVFQDITSNSN
jgi:hypothetical protein